MKPRYRYQLVDVFTDTPLTGNPLAVFVNAKGLNDGQMQGIAREMNLSETVFFLPAERGGHARLRIFTPRVELPFAGHPVLGSAWVLGQPMEMPRLVLETGVGPIVVELKRCDGLLHHARMKQPFPRFDQDFPRDELLRALGTNPDRSSLLEPVRAINGPEHFLVEVRSKSELDALAIDESALSKVAGSHGTLAYAQEKDTCFCRYFAPGAGIVEDPATGSANGPLAVLLHQHGRLAPETELVVHQGRAMGRPSVLHVSLHQSPDGALDVWVGGQAVVIARGELSI